MRIVEHDLEGDEIAAFLGEHLRQMREVTPLESKHALDLDELRTDDVTFWVAIDDDGTIVGTCAIKRLNTVDAEVKSMRTATDRVRGGIASALLTHLVDHARASNVRRLSLETGSAPYFEPARRLYAKHGFTACEPFADYGHDPHSAYFTRLL